MRRDRMISSEALLRAVDKELKTADGGKRAVFRGRLRSAEALNSLMSRIGLAGEDGKTRFLVTNRAAEFWENARFKDQALEIVCAPPAGDSPALSVISVRLRHIDERIKEYAAGDMEVYSELLSAVERLPKEKLSGLISQEMSIGDREPAADGGDAGDFRMRGLGELRAKYAVLRSKYSRPQRSLIENLMSRFESSDTDEKSRILKQLGFYVNFINGADVSVLSADVKKVREALDESFIGQDAIKDRLCRSLSAYQKDPAHRAPRFALTGRAGRDAEGLISEFCRLAGLRLSPFSCAGLYDAASIVGSSTVYSNATVGSFAELLATGGQGALLIKDVDKIKSDDVLMAFRPLVFGVYKNDLLPSDVDVSSVWIFFTAEDSSRLSMLDSAEMNVLEMSGYSDEEMRARADRSRKDFLKENGLAEDLVRFSPEVCRDLALRYARKSNVLDLRGIVREVTGRALKDAPIVIDSEALPSYYGLLREKERLRGERLLTAAGIRDKFTLLKDEMDRGIREKVEELLDDYDSAPAMLRKGLEKKLTDLGNLCGRPDLTAALGRLDEVRKRVYGMEEPLEIVADQIWARGKNPALRLAPLLLSGPAGVGKTLFADSLAECLGLPAVHIPFNQIADPQEITGFPSMRPGLLGKLCESGAMSLSAVVVIDELDKPGHPQLYNALYNIFDKQMARDAWYDCSYSTDGLLFICTANDPLNIPFPLLDRCCLVELRSFSRAECLKIAKDYIAPRLKRELDCESGISDEVLKLLVDSYALTGGMRELESCLDILCRRAGRRALTEGREPIIDESFVKEILGEPLSAKARPRDVHSGRVSALAVFGPVGAVIEIEVCEGAPGKSGVTGLARGSYLESVELAENVASRLLGKDIGDVFVHSSPAEIEKQGPSAGIALLAAMISYSTGIPLPGIALTGELRAYGGIERVGNINEKLRAAAAAGLETVYIPAANYDEAEAAGYLDGLELRVIPVSDAKELAERLFSGVSFRSLAERRQR